MAGRAAGSTSVSAGRFSQTIPPGTYPPPSDGQVRFQTCSGQSPFEIRAMTIWELSERSNILDKPTLSVRGFGRSVEKQEREPT